MIEVWYIKISLGHQKFTDVAHAETTKEQNNYVYNHSNYTYSFINEADSSFMTTSDENVINNTLTVHR